MPNVTGADDKFGPIEYIPLDQLDFGDKNVRHRDITADLDELAYSMDKFGLQQPIIVEVKGNRFEIISGQRRYYAAKQLGWPNISARRIKIPLSVLDAKVISFSENIQRRELSPGDKADACAYLLDQLGTPRAVAQHLGITEQTVKKWIDYAKVPEELKALVQEDVVTRDEVLRLFRYVPSTEKAVIIARRMKEIKAPKRDRDRILASTEESPESSTDNIFRRAEEKKRSKTIIFVLPEKWSSAIDLAATRLGVSPNELARDATIEWLQMMKY